MSADLAAHACAVSNARFPQRMSNEGQLSEGQLSEDQLSEDQLSEDQLSEDQSFK